MRPPAETGSRGRGGARWQTGGGMAGRLRRGAQADGRRQVRQAEAGRAGRRAEQPQKYSGTFGACEGAKIFGDIWAAGSPPKKRAWEKDRAFFGTVVLPDGGLLRRASGYAG